MSGVLISLDTLPLLLPGEAHVWYVRINPAIANTSIYGKPEVLYESQPWDSPLEGQPIGHSNPFLTYLSADERDRARRFVFERDRIQYVMVRGILRCLLGGYLVLNPAEIHFSYGACGKPALAGCLAGRLRFNLSHAGNWVAYAICVDREVGIDIEPLRNDISWRQLAPLVFSLHEQSELAKVPIQEKTAAFLRGWTRKEAYIKGCGEGLSLALESFDVPLGALTAPCQVKSPLIAKVPLREWWLYPIKFSKDVTATLAVEGHPIPVKVYRWSDAQLASILNSLASEKFYCSMVGRAPLSHFLLGSQVNPDVFEICVHARCHSNLSMFS